MTVSDALYSQKSDGYYGHIRHEPLTLLPGHLGDVLDIGGGNGGTARHLLDAGRATSCLVVDPFSTAEDEGALRFSRSSVDDARWSAELTEAGERFDTVLFLDVLEHLYDPWSVLRDARSLLRPDGRILVSIPNARFVGVTVPLVLWGRFDYKPAGVMDRTHIRWFTRATLLDMIGQAGFRVEKVGVHVEPRVAPINRLTLGLFEPFFVYQYYVYARPA